MRDRAILLLLARLALRVGDVLNLRFSDIDWDNTQLRVCGKSKRETALPLPQDAGDALLDYLWKARPRVDEEPVFLRLHAPFRPLFRLQPGFGCRTPCARPCRRCDKREPGREP